MRQRVTLYLFAVEEMSMTEIAATFGCTGSAVSLCLKRVLPADLQVAGALEEMTTFNKKKAGIK